MKIIIDSREQLKLDFPKTIEIEVKKLDYGDYACEGCNFVFERKSIGDAYGTMGKGHTRFKKELERCINDNNKLYLIIEGTFTKVAKGYRYSKLPPKVLFKIMGTMLHKYKDNFEVIFCKNRKEMSLEIIWRFESFVRNLSKGGKP